VDYDDQTGTFRFDDDAILHLGPESATVVRDFTWDQIGDYAAHFAGDAAQGRLVTMGRQTESWTSWERHPAGEELVLLLSGRVDLIQDLDGNEHRIELHAGEGVLNPPGVWHTSDVHEPGDALFITPGEGTEHRPR
jgi:quercetin dioxygenase-like cupin family protein